MDWTCTPTRASLGLRPVHSGLVLVGPDFRARISEDPMSKSNPKPATTKSASKANGLPTKAQRRSEALEAPEAPAVDVETPPRTSKLDAMIAQLGRPQGATIADLMQVTGWQAHSVRGAIAGAC